MQMVKGYLVIICWLVYVTMSDFEKQVEKTMETVLEGGKDSEEDDTKLGLRV